MRSALWKNLSLVVAVLMVSACSTVTTPTNGAVPQLFTLEPTPDRSALQKTAQGYLATLLEDPANAEFKLLALDPSLIASGSGSIAVRMPDGKSVQFEHDISVPAIGAGFDGWVGYKRSEWKLQHPSAPSEINIDPLYYLSLVRDGNTVVGQLILEGQRYHIETIGAGKYVLVKIDETKLPPEAEPIAGPADITTTPSPTSRHSTHSTIRVLMVSTNEARAANPNYRAGMAKALQDANAYMLNSGVAVTYELAGYFDADYAETGKNSQLGDLQNPSRPLGASVAPVREALRADLVTMYSTTRNYCGMAFVTASRAYGFSVVACLSSMSHELGHNLGANHNWAPPANEGKPPYMFGYRYTGGPRFRTQMSYDCSDGTCPRIPYHSTPRVTYQGIPIGTVEHHDVARRFNERRETVERFYAPFLKVTLYEHVNFQGKMCILYYDYLSEVKVDDVCGAGFSRLVSSARVEGFKPGLTVVLMGVYQNDLQYYQSQSYSGTLELPDLSGNHELPAGMSAWQRGDSVKDQLGTLLKY